MPRRILSAQWPLGRQVFRELPHQACHNSLILSFSSGLLVQIHLETDFIQQTVSFLARHALQRAPSFALYNI